MRGLQVEYLLLIRNLKTCVLLRMHAKVWHHNEEIQHLEGLMWNKNDNEYVVFHMFSMYIIILCWWEFWFKHIYFPN